MIYSHWFVETGLEQLNYSYSVQVERKLCLYPSDDDSMEKEFKKLQPLIQKFRKKFPMTIVTELYLK